MATVTVLSEAETPIEGSIVDGAVLVDDSGLASSLGWELKPQGLCQGDVCVPVADQESLRRDGMLDLGAVANALGQSVAVDASLGAIAISTSSQDRNGVVQGQPAPELALPNADGDLVSLADFRGRKTLIVSFASW